MPGTLRQPSVLALTAAIVGALALGTSACSSATVNSMSGTQVATVLPTSTGNFSGTGPSSLASLASAGAASAASAQASASAANEARASQFAASAHAQSQQDSATYHSTLAAVSGRGNAVADVEVQGVPKSQTGGLHAVIVRITNHSNVAASYAVQIDFDDNSGNIVDSDVVGTMHLAAGAVATPVAFSTKDPNLTLVPVIAKAQRF